MIEKGHAAAAVISSWHTSLSKYKVFIPEQGAELNAHPPGCCTCKYSKGKGISGPVKNHH